MGNGHYLAQPVVYDRATASKRVRHATGSQVVCSCGEAFILIAADDYARLLARAIAGPQKGA